jgi:hypothetical protein
MRRTGLAAFTGRPDDVSGVYQDDPTRVRPLHWGLRDGRWTQRYTDIGDGGTDPYSDESVTSDPLQPHARRHLSFGLVLKTLAET